MMYSMMWWCQCPLVMSLYLVPLYDVWHDVVVPLPHAEHPLETGICCIVVDVSLYKKKHNICVSHIWLRLCKLRFRFHGEWKSVLQLITRRLGDLL